MEGFWIDIDTDNALLAAIREGHGSALHGGELGADEIVAEIEKLLFAEGVAGEADLHNRHGGRRIDDHQGWSGAGRQKPQERLRDGSGLCERGLNVRAGLEEDLDQREAGERLRLDVLHIVHQHGHAAFDVGNDALFHFLRLQTVVGPDQRDDGNVDIGENIYRRAQKHDRREQKDDECHHDKGVRPRQC